MSVYFAQMGQREGLVRFGANLSYSKYEADRKGISEEGMIFMEARDLSQIERRPGLDLTLPQLHDAEQAKRDDLQEQLQSRLQLHGQVTLTRP